MTVVVVVLAPTVESSEEEWEEEGEATNDLVARTGGGGETLEASPPPPPPPRARASFSRARDSSNSCRRISTSRNACCARSRHAWVLSAVGCVFCLQEKKKPATLSQLGSARLCLDQSGESTENRRRRKTTHRCIRRSGSPHRLQFPLGGVALASHVGEDCARLAKRIKHGRAFELGFLEVAPDRNVPACAGAGVSTERLEDEGEDEGEGEGGPTRGRVRACP